MTKASDYCPSCGKRISWIQKWKFANWANFRKSSPCPMCGKLLIWSKWPFRIMNMGLILLIIKSLVSIIEAVKDRKLDLALFIIALLLVLWGAFTMKLEVSCSDKKNES
jgi:endogenous inhibitor of DNA gyrase (YacG/DUF329 family)